MNSVRLSALVWVFMCVAFGVETTVIAEELPPGEKHDGEDWTKRDLHGRTFVRWSLCRVNMERVVFEDADLTGADLTGANLSYVNFRNANLTGADLRKTRSSGPMDMTGANFSGANLEGMDLTGTYTQFKETKF